MKYLNFRGYLNFLDYLYRLEISYLFLYSLNQQTDLVCYRLSNRLKKVIKNQANKDQLAKCQIAMDLVDGYHAISDLVMEDQVAH